MKMNKLRLLLALLAINSFSVTAQTVAAFAGNNAIAGYAGDNGPANSSACHLHDPGAITHDAAGNFYFLDMENYVVRKISNSGVITTIAGTGNPNTVADNAGGVPATSVDLDVLSGIAIDDTGNIYFGEGAHIRKITPSGMYYNFAGTGSGGFTGNGGPATAANIQPVAIAIDAAGTVYFSEYYNNAVRKISTSGIVSACAGQGPTMPGFSGDGGPATAAMLHGPRDIKCDATGNLYIIDATFGLVRKVAVDGTISTVAGDHTALPGFSGDGGPATSAQLNSPNNVAIDAAGNIFISDLGNLRIRRVNTSGNISTYVGTTTWVWNGNGHAGPATSLWGVDGLTIYNGDLYFAEAGNDVIRKISTAATAVPSIIHTGIELTLFPDPNVGKFQLSGNISPEDNSVNVSISDITGRTIYNANFAATNGELNIPVDISSLASAGIYCIKVSSASASTTRRFVKE